MEKILISGGFKNSTHTLKNTFNKLLGKDNVMRTHNFPWENSELDSYDIIIIPYRNNEEVYPSAFFQDILVDKYIYSPYNENNFLAKFKDLSLHDKKEIINRVDINELVKLYKIINWDDFVHLNNKIRLHTINSHYGINIDYYCNDIQVFEVNTKKIISFNIKNLNDTFCEKIWKHISGKDENIKIINSNTSDTKWYKKRYEEFKKKLTVKNIA